MSSILVSCLVLIDSDNSILTTQRPQGKSLGGFWEFPGGKIEHGELPEVALRRELQEELNLDVNELVRLTSVFYEYDFAHITLLPFLSRCINRPVIHLIEHQAYQWLPMDRLHQVNWAPADLPILEELKTVLTLNDQ